jgi:hypothetical protein
MPSWHEEGKLYPLPLPLFSSYFNNRLRISPLLSPHCSSTSPALQHYQTVPTASQPVCISTLPDCTHCFSTSLHFNITRLYPLLLNQSALKHYQTVPTAPQPVCTSTLPDCTHCSSTSLHFNITPVSSIDTTDSSVTHPSAPDRGVRSSPLNIGVISIFKWLIAWQSTIFIHSA